MTMTRPAPFALLVLLALAGCGPDTARNLGFTRDPPDEFQVTTRAPLSVPPALGDLPPPTPGAPRPQEARSAAGLLAPSTAGATAPSTAERALVARAGGPVGDDIRRRVDAETLRLDRPDPGVVDRLMFWRDTPQPGVTVDPTRESQRLRENAALGRDSTAGETPIVQPNENRGERSLLGRLFNW
jgi:hypothetical protein